ncbi:uncharacterized protein [Watersipora subatra]|uniref:uncharacterized protein n=1 Tax=Watersipora subatra TaxID=2589382 RepID=UPI00355C69D4
MADEDIASHDHPLNGKNNDAGEEDPSVPTTPLPSRTESQLSQTTDIDGTAASRHSSMARPSSTKSGISRNPSANSFVTVSSAGRKSRAKSSASTDLPDVHQVTFTVTVSAAVPAGDRPAKLFDIERQRVYEDGNERNKSKRVVSDPKPQAFYHIEYYLLPTDVDPNKTDITLFGIAAKIYPDKQDAKVMKTWTEGNKTWIAWSQSHVINLTSDMLKKFCYHKLVVRIWDTRDKFGPKARFDRPRAFKFPPPKPGEDLDDISGVKTFIARLVKAYTRRLPKNSRERTLPQPVVSESKAKGKIADSEFTQNAGLPDTEPHPVTVEDSREVPCLLLGHPDMEYRVYSKLLELAKLEMQHLDKKVLRKNLDVFRKSPTAEAADQDAKETTSKVKQAAQIDQGGKAAGHKSTTPVSRQKRFPRDKKNEQVAKEAAEYAKKHGICSIHVPVAPLFVVHKISAIPKEIPHVCLSKESKPTRYGSYIATVFNMDTEEEYKVYMPEYIAKEALPDREFVYCGLIYKAKPKRIKFPHYSQDKPNHTHQIDLLSLPTDKGYKYALTVVDIASRYKEAEPLKKKTAADTVEAIKCIYNRSPLEYPKEIMSDKGREFIGTFTELMNEKGIKISRSLNKKKVAFVERFNRTLSERLFAHQYAEEIKTDKTNQEWVKRLPGVVAADK